tara:strand:- start:11513 stop:14266 length:2754 start_codon:yes stop_codon:yes gene_type:complete
MTRARSLSQLANSSVFTVATNNRVGIGSEIPTTKLDVDGALNVSGNAAFGGVITYEDVTNIDSVGIITARTDLSIADKIIHTGDTNTAIRFPTADTVTVETAGSERVRIKSDGTLHAIKTGTQITNAEQTVAVFQRSSASGTTSKISIVSGNGAASHINFGDTDDEDIGQLIYDHSNNSMQFLTNTSEKMRIDSSGRLLLGTTTEGYSTSDDLTIATSGHTGMTIRSGTSNNGSIHFSDGTSGNAEYRGVIEYSHTVDSLGFYTEASEKMRIDSSGRMGIATQSPTHLLSITGTANNVNSEIRITAASIASGYIGANSNGLNLGTDTAGIVFKTGVTGGGSVGGTGTERMRIDSSGRLLLGTATANGYTDRLLTVGDASTSSVTAEIRSSSQGQISFSDGVAQDAGSYRGIVGYNHGSDYMYLYTNATERMRITSAGYLGLGTIAPNYLFHSTGTIGVGASGLSQQQLSIGNNAIQSLVLGVGYTNMSLNALGGNVAVGTASPLARLDVVDSNAMSTIFRQSTGNQTSVYIKHDDNSGRIGSSYAAGGGAYKPLAFETSGIVRMTIDSSGRALVGTSAARTDYFNNTLTARLQVEGINHSGNVDRAALSIVNNNAATIYESPLLIMGRSAGSTYNSKTLVPNQYVMGRISFQGADGSDMCEGAFIEGFVNGTPGANDMPGGLRFATTSDGGSAATERMRITSAGHIHIGKTDANFSIGGSTLYNNGAAEFVMNAGTVMNVNRMTNDGRLIGFYQNSSLEGDISVSGTTVSYNGAHLSRWSQLPGGAERTEILRGSVLSNLDEMCEWGEEDNEQLNRMQVSDVEGDRNVAGVFQDWDDDDDVYTNDFHCAMTGDFVIRIAQGTTVARGDLLMSAGDGTAKPQDDDIVRSKTIAKVTSTTVSSTYSDGSYCVPCVLMAC